MVRMTTEAPSLKPMMRAIEAEAARKKVEAVLALLDSVDEGTLALQDFLEAAHTKTGLYREEYLGGFPGRHRSGEMVASISNNTSNPEYDGKRTIMAFGWFAGQFREYFIEQDLGVGGIPAANAMRDAAMLAIQRMNARMAEWEKGTLNPND